MGKWITPAPFGPTMTTSPFGTSTPPDMGGHLPRTGLKDLPSVSPRTRSPAWSPINTRPSDNFVEPVQAMSMPVFSSVHPLPASCMRRICPLRPYTTTSPPRTPDPPKKLPPHGDFADTNESPPSIDE